jgi:peptidoglycan/LPS O-acetylase OafA/YrhL
MSDVVMRVFPGSIEWLYDRARLAVQVFLVCSGFLTAAGMAQMQTLTAQSGLVLLWRRYLRLVLPLLAALSAAVLVSEIIRPWFDHSSLSAVPRWPQVLAHLTLAQHLLDMEALSAGVWYVAVDFQLYATALLVFFLSQRLAARSAATPSAWRWQLWLLLTAASLLWWGGHASLDDYALYFFSSYGLGFLAFKRRNVCFSGKTWGLVILLALLSWWMDPRWRLVTALSVAAVLAHAPQTWLQAPLAHNFGVKAVQWLSQRSYSIFVIHFSVSLAVNAVVSRMWPEQLWPNLLGMLASLGLSVCAGALLYQHVEQVQATVQRWVALAAIFMTSAAVAMQLNSAWG